jgi:hypothetical protein
VDTKKKELSMVIAAPDCTGSAVCFSPLWVLRSSKLRLRFAKPSESQNRALRRLVQEGRLHIETRALSTGSEIKFLWHRNYRFYKRAADEVFKLVDWYATAATDGALGMQGEHLMLAAFARQRFLLLGEEANGYGDKVWTTTGHDLDFIFERDGTGYGIEVKNTLGYLDIGEFLTKIKLARHIGLDPTVVSPAAISIREIEWPRKFFNPIAINLRLGPRKPTSIAKKHLQDREAKPVRRLFAITRTWSPGVSVQ